MTDAWDWWSRALEDKKSIGKPHLPVSVDSPEQGFYKVRRKDKPWEPVAIWRDENGEWVALRSGKPYAPTAVWNWCCRNPITAEEYEQALAGLGWDVDDPTVAAQMGHNVGGTDDLTILADQIEAARQGAEAYKDIESEEQAAKAQSLRARMNELAGTADKKRETLKKPYFEAGKAIDLQWMPLVKEAKAVADQIKRYIETYKTAQLLERRRLELERQRLEAESALGDVAPPPPLPPVDTTVKGSYGRGASVRTKQVVTGISDHNMLFLHLINSGSDISQYMMKLAQKEIDEGSPVPGVIVEEKAVVS